ncbi:MAG TPA: NrfD/PsrC family molybdoenzyme membrane anchor subunit, partial [Pyrinomonadaceae bacterium]|nr:NrfD/PsrC family molybdoenzyme membrane anchor subunit [Pyrinomonadaceae bacterium]
AFIIAGYTIVLALHFIASWAGSTKFQSWLMIAGIPFSMLTAIYTAYLFAQAKARDMWQNPLLPPHLFFQAVLLGSAILLPVIAILNAAAAVYWLLWTLALSSVIHLLMVWGEVSLTHPTAHARLAIWEMVKGRYKNDFWMGTILSLLGGLLPLLSLLGVINVSFGVGGAPLALIGMMLFENSYVQAGQSVPLA